MATNHRWELLVVLLLTLQPTMGDADRHRYTSIKNDHGGYIIHRKWETTPKTDIKHTIKSTTFDPPVPYTWSTTVKPANCLEFGDVVLRLSRIGIRVVGNNVVDSVRVTELHLDDNGITEISCGAFNKVPRLETLNLTLNNISTDQLLSFEEHKRLRRLILDDNKYRNTTNSELTMFKNSLPNLWELSLRRSFIAVFSVSLIDFAPNLARLSLSGNKIESSEFLKNAPKNLKYLDLSENKISKIGAWLPNNLVELTVAGNRIEELCAEDCEESSLSLQNLVNLRILNASRNAITTVKADAFQWLSNLTVLDLSRNEIHVLHETLWGRSWQIQKLHLAKNKLTSIPKLCELRNLQHLDLSGNSITSVFDENICRTLQQLQFLFLSDNYILEVDGTAFRKFNALRTLDLSGNVLTTVPKNLINATYLELLFIRNNRINTLENLDKEWSRSLRELHLQDNPLLFIHTSWINSDSLPHLQIMLKDRPTEDKPKYDQKKDEDKSTQEEDDYS